MNVDFDGFDLVILQNPFKELNFRDADLSFASDWHVDDQNKFQVNAGFFLARSTPKSIAFFDYWYNDHETR